jgi:2-keto-4-pentenoate hydratase
VALPALEIVDSRIEGWNIKFTDTVADNASSGLFVSVPTEAAERDLAATWEPDHQRRGRSSGNSAAAWRPLERTRWLAVQAYRFGDPLRAGHLILSGALGRSYPSPRG